MSSVAYNEVWDAEGNLVEQEIVELDPAFARLLAMRDQLRSQGEGAIATLDQYDAAWDKLSPEDKDAALRMCVRVTARLVRFALGQFGPQDG